MRPYESSRAINGTRLVIVIISILTGMAGVIAIGTEEFATGFSLLGYTTGGVLLNFILKGFETMVYSAELNIEEKKKKEEKEEYILKGFETMVLSAELQIAEKRQEEENKEK